MTEYNVDSSLKILIRRGKSHTGSLVSDLQTAIQLDESAADIQTRKFTGKELDRMHGLDWHDLGARRYDAAVVTFTQIDPLCEKYYHVSPYAYCAGNPIRYVDPDGREICYSMTEEQKEAFNRQLQPLLDNSELFKTVYSSLEESKNVYTVKFDETSQYTNNEEVDGLFSSAKSISGGTVVFSAKYANGENIPINGMYEEFFHAYQNDNIANYSEGNFNMEFEAKCFVTMASCEYGAYPNLGNNEIVGAFQDKLRLCDAYGSGNQFVTPENVVSKAFTSDYMHAANSFAKDYANQRLGNGHYLKSTEVAPASLQKLIKEAYRK